MSDVKLHRFLVLSSVISWLIFLACNVLQYTVGGCSWAILLSGLAASVLTVMLARHTSGNY